MSHAGSFLVARPSLKDSNFARTVVLLLEHGPAGAFGVVVNRPATAEGLPFPVFWGGPCEAPGLILLHGHRDWLADADPEPEDESEKREIAPGVYTGDAACLDKALAADKGEGLKFRVFHGYAGWGGGQLEGELSDGSWEVAPATGELLFGTPPEDLWDRLAPPRIPQPSVN
jgi:putative transcriptional regulator